MSVIKVVKLVGSRQGKCNIEGPHWPHYTGETYETVRHGTVRKFCIGVPDSDEDFIIEGTRGCACSLSKYTITIKKGTGKIISRTKPTHDGRCA